MDKAKLVSNQIKSLLQVAEEQGRSVPFSEDDVQECLDMSDPQATNRCLDRLHRAVHEIVYSPPAG